MDNRIEKIEKELLEIRNIKNDDKWFYAWVITTLLWFSTIIGFVWHLNQYDFASYTYEQDGDGYNNVNTGMQGDVNNGTKTNNTN
jgi:hypothetical protein